MTQAQHRASTAQQLKAAIFVIDAVCEDVPHCIVIMSPLTTGTFMQQPWTFAESGSALKTAFQEPAGGSGYCDCEPGPPAAEPSFGAFLTAAEAAAAWKAPLPGAAGDAAAAAPALLASSVARFLSFAFCERDKVGEPSSTLSTLGGGCGGPLTTRTAGDEPLSAGGGALGPCVSK